MREAMEAPRKIMPAKFGPVPPKGPDPDAPPC